MTQLFDPLLRDLRDPGARQEACQFSVVGARVPLEAVERRGDGFPLADRRRGPRSSGDLREPGAPRRDVGGRCRETSP